MLSPYFVSTGTALSIGDVIFWCFIVLMCILVFVSVIREKDKPTILASGKSVICSGKCRTSDDISCIKCTQWLERVEVYSAGKRVLSFPWEMDNSELFIAWIHRCGIAFKDYRMKAFQ